MGARGPLVPTVEAADNEQAPLRRRLDRPTVGLRELPLMKLRYALSLGALVLSFLLTLATMPFAASVMR